MSGRAVSPLQAKAPVPVATVQGGILQRKCACGNHSPGGGECGECRKKRMPLQRKASGSGEISGVPPIVHEVLQQPGQPLDAASRAFFEPRFGRDFSGVRVHTDGKAAESARALGAAAYTNGRDIVFGAGRHVPGNSTSQALMAHEIAHVVQSGNRGGDTLKPAVSGPQSHAERQADAMAALALRGLPVRIGMPARLNAWLNLAPETWYRGEVAGVAPITSAGVEGGHDLGDGLYLTDRESVAGEYADTRLDEHNRLKKNKLPASARRVLSTEIDPQKMGRVLDLTKDERWAKFLKEPGLEGMGPDYPTKGDLIKTPRNYNSFFKEYCQRYQIDVEKYDVIIGPETLRTGKQMCIRNPALREQVRKSFVPVKPGGGGRGPGSGGGGEPHEEESAGPRRSAPRTGAVPGEPNKDVKPGTPARPAAGVPPESEPAAGPSGGRRPARAGGSQGRSTGASPSPRSIVGGMLLNLGAGVALGFFQAWFKDKVARDLEALPKPKIDKRGAQDFLSDPQAAGSVHLLDLFNKNLKPFGKELEDNHRQFLTGVNLKIMLIALAVPPEGKYQDVSNLLEKADDIDAELGEYDQLLSTIGENLDAILAMESKALETKKAADDLKAFLKNGYVISWLFHQGFSVEDISKMDSNLSYLSASIGLLFEDTRQTKALLARLRAETSAQQKGVKKIWWDLFARQVRQTIKQREEEDARNKPAEAKPLPATPPIAAEAKPAPTKSPPPASQSRIPKAKLWDRTQQALREAQNISAEPESASDEKNKAALDELWKLVGNIEYYQAQEFTHEEERLSLRTLKGQLLKEIARQNDMRSRGNL